MSGGGKTHQPLQMQSMTRPGEAVTNSSRYGTYGQWSRDGEVIAWIQIRVSEDYLTLNYRARNHGEDWQTFDYRVFLDWTACRLGGRRAWFRCPARGCGRRVAVLYGGTIFACRHCHQLAYDSQREQWDDRVTRRAEKIRRRLGWEAGILNDCGVKPKGMHWRTFERLQAEHDAYVDASLAHMMMRFGKIADELGDFRPARNQSL